jgi:hypothetical protein
LELNRGSNFNAISIFCGQFSIDIPDRLVLLIALKDNIIAGGNVDPGKLPWIKT